MGIADEGKAGDDEAVAAKEPSKMDRINERPEKKAPMKEAIADDDKAGDDDVKESKTEDAAKKESGNKTKKCPECKTVTVPEVLAGKFTVVHLPSSNSLKVVPIRKLLR